MVSAVMAAPENARPYLYEMWQLKFLGEQDIGKIAVLKGREKEFLAWTESQSFALRTALESLRGIPSVTANDLVGVLDHFLGQSGTRPPGLDEAVRARATATVQLARSGFPSALLQVFERPVPLGQGGFARVFRATHRDLRQEVAVKIPTQRTALAGQNFLNEVALWRDLDHPNIVRLLDYNIIPVPYLAMEYMDRGDLQQRLDDRGAPFDAPNTLRILLDVSSALRYAHVEKNTIHGDIKLSNLLINRVGKVKVSDWASGRLMSGVSRGVYGYTPEYVAPEQLRGEPRTSKTDMYHLGGVVFHLVTGKAPFDGYVSEEHLRALVEQRGALKPSDLLAEAEPWDDLVARCLAKDPDSRPDIVEFEAIVRHMVSQ